MIPEIAEYIASQPDDIRPRLYEVYNIIKAELPHATEKIAYRMPTFWHGRNLIHFAACKSHIGLYPGGEATTFFAPQLSEYKTRKGAIQLPNAKPLPIELIANIARWIGKQLAG